jgi:hypothetical protein
MFDQQQQVTETTSAPLTSNVGVPRREKKVEQEQKSKTPLPLQICLIMLGGGQIAYLTVASVFTLLTNYFLTPQQCDLIDHLLVPESRASLRQDLGQIQWIFRSAISGFVLAGGSIFLLLGSGFMAVFGWGYFYASSVNGNIVSLLVMPFMESGIQFLFSTFLKPKTPST